MFIILRSANQSQEVPSELILHNFLMRLRKTLCETKRELLGIWSAVVVEDSVQNDSPLEIRSSAVEVLSQIPDEITASALYTRT